VVAGAIALAVVVVSLIAFVGQGRDGGPAVDAARRTGTSAPHPTPASSTTTSTTTATTTTSTTTTIAPPPTAAPAPAPAAPPAPPAPAPVEVAPPAPGPAPGCDGSGNAIIDAMNADRAASGLGALCGNGQLAGFAQDWANWMAQNGSLTHQDLNRILAATTFNTIAENILDGAASLTPGQMESAWMQSPPHRENILNGTYRAAGVGIAYSPDGRVWVAVDFGG
jgi:uncharacterized protein YkwD